MYEITVFGGGEEVVTLYATRECDALECADLINKARRKRKAFVTTSRPMGTVYGMFREQYDEYVKLRNGN